MLYGTKGGQLFGFRDGYSFFGSGLCGGYPQSTGYRFFIRNTNFEEVISDKKPYPLGDGNPESSEAESLIEGEVTRLPYAAIYPRVFSEGDIFHYTISGGPGFGDPLERSYELCEKDANEGIYTPDVLERVYGVVVEKVGDRWVVNREKSETLREKMRKKRAERAMDFEEFWLRERRKITEGELKEHVKRMFRESIALSKNWGKEFKDFWLLDEVVL